MAPEVTKAKVGISFNDVKEVIRRANEVWGSEAAKIWLDSSNSYLDGARPRDVLKLEGPDRILRILDAEMWGRGA